VLPEHVQDPVDVLLCTRQHGGARPGIRVHRGILGDQEVTHIDGIPVTTIARTLLDLSSMSARDLERALGAGERMQPDLRDQLATLLARYPKRRGTGTLRMLLADPSSGTFTRSEAEDRLLEPVRAADLPRPDFNAMLFGYEVDCLWREAGLVVEVDGFAFHSSQRAFVRDRRRDGVFIAAGMQLLRLTWHQLTRERDRTISLLAQAISRRTNPR
jgi:very-short-patch-repair endonuclease